MAKIWTVDKNKMRLPWEEYEYLRDRMGELGNFFSWDVHPNVIEMDNRIRKRLQKKLAKLVDSEEFQYYYPWYKL